MVFGRRKSSTKVDPAQEDAEARQRNRLSKPPTNRSVTNLTALANQDNGTRSKDASTSNVVLSPASLSTPVSADARQQIRSHLFDADNTPAPSPTKSLKSQGSWSGVAYMVSRFEANEAMSNSSQQSLVSPTKTKRPISKFFGKRRPSAGRQASFPSVSSNERLSSLKTEDAIDTVSPASSLDKVVDTPAIPTSRRASFTPGTATRKSSATQSLKEDANRPEAERETIPEADEASSDDGTDDDDWLPPAQMNRSETPCSLEYTHLGGVRFGSLHVTNGRSSPAMSEMSKLSKNLLSLARPAPNRNVSSEYGDLESEERFVAPIEADRNTATPKLNEDNRDFSWYANGVEDVNTRPNENVATPRVANRHQETANTTSMMAAEYMAELPVSPFSTERSSPSAGFPLRSRSADSIRRSPSLRSLQRTPSFGPVLHGSSSTISSLHQSSSPTGSVLRITTKRAEVEDELFDDETFGSSTVSSRASPESWHSPLEPVSTREEAFQSAVEFQVLASPQRLKPATKTGKSDSGYSSNNSLRSISGEHGRSVKQAGPRAMPATDSDLGREVGIAARIFRPILKTRKTAPEVPIFKDLRPPMSTATTSVSDVTVVTAITTSPNPTTDVFEVQPKLRKKLQKRRASQIQPKDITLQRSETPDISGIPPIPENALNNLRIRSQAVPELEHTFRSMHHVRNQASMSSMNLLNFDIRFPSPDPEGPVWKEHLRHRSRSRSRSQSRPSSFIGKVKEEKSNSKRDSGISKVEAMAIIDTFSVAVPSLGGSPYDMASKERRSRDLPRPPINSYNISTRTPRPRSMMDDRTAAELARARSKSIHERDDSNDRRLSFNDRGGIPGKNLRPASIILDVPPLPPMPTSDMVRHGYRSPAEKRMSIKMSSSPAPPPPPHSPQPFYIDVEDDIEDLSLAPPPPSHSPRPINVSTDPWAAQAAAWRSRRQSAGEALKQTWSPSHSGYQDEYAIEDEPAYPDIPPREVQRGRGVANMREYHGEESPYSSRTRHNWPAQSGPLHSYFSRDDPFRQPSPQRGQPLRSHPVREPMFDHHEHHRGLKIQQPYQYNEASVRGRYDEEEHFSDLQPVVRSRSQPQHYFEDEHTTHPSQRPLPTPSPRPYEHHSQPRSRAGSFRSVASSMAEELHPADLERQQPAPDYGRYSGGMNYGYEGRGAGFGGSAGTRCASGKADAAWKGVELRQNTGIDLGDVPIMMEVMKRMP